jgi:pimeloyl-ACP methyl ester carboxylesterase
MWRHQLGDPDLKRRFRVIALNVPWHGRSMPPQEQLRTEYLLSSDFYRRFIRAFCDALKLERPVLAGCSMEDLYSFIFFSMLRGMMEDGAARCGLLLRGTLSPGGGL